MPRYFFFPILFHVEHSGSIRRPRILCLGMSAPDAIYQVAAIPPTPTKVLATTGIGIGSRTRTIICA